MSDTPETDYAYKNHPWDMHDNIPLEFARQLERERDRLAEELDALKQSMLDLSHPNMKLLLEERNEARTSSVCTHGTTTASAQGWALKHEAVTEQRDRLAEALRIVMADYRLDGRVSAEADLLACDALAAVEGENNE
jgi:hypothetical protein